MHSDAKNFFSWYSNQTIFFLAARISFLGKIFFSRSSNNFLFAREKNLAARKKSFCHYIEKKNLGIRKHVIRTV